MTDYLTDLMSTVAQDVWRTFQHNWPYLLASVVVASAVQVFLKPEFLATWMRKRLWVAVLAAVALGALTPFCSCGTTAVVLGAMASSVPWAPIVSFLVSSPLTSPEQYVMSVGLFGPAFSNIYFAASVAAGLLGGLAAWWLERRGLLEGQARVTAPAVNATAATASCCTKPAPPVPTSSTGEAAPAPANPPRGAVLLTLRDVTVAPTVASTTTAVRFGRALVANLRKLAVYFFGFAALGYLVIRIIPTGVLTDLLGQGNPVWSVPLAALLGIPVYLNSDGSLPLVASLMDGGMSPGAAIAFLITGAGTSVGAVSGMLVIARWRIVALVVGTLLVTSVIAGWLAVLWL